MVQVYTPKALHNISCFPLSPRKSQQPKNHIYHPEVYSAALHNFLKAITLVPKSKHTRLIFVSNRILTQPQKVKFLEIEPIWYKTVAYKMNSIVHYSV